MNFLEELSRKQSHPNVLYVYWTEAWGAHAHICIVQKCNSILHTLVTDRIELCVCTCMCVCKLIYVLYVCMYACVYAKIDACH